LRALLLAAGLGTRLRPLTNHIPKCLVPIHGRPLLDYWLETLVDNGVEQVLINTHYMAPMVRRYLSQSTWWPYITLVHEETLLGTGGTILQNRDFFRDETFLVAHADNLTIFNFDSFVNNHSNRPVGCDMTMMVFETTDPKSCGIVELDSYGVLQSFHEKVDSPPSNLANAAVYIFEQSIIEYLILLNKLVIDISTEVIPMHTRKFFSYYNRLYHRDIGTIDSWNKANHEFPLTPHNKINNKAWLNIIGKKNIYAKVMELRS
jgi:mannose-1-phosphate guanylyltransferase